jgi:hypothetical protein
MDDSVNNMWISIVGNKKNDLVDLWISFIISIVSTNK